MEQDITDWKNLWKVEKSTPIDINGLLKHINNLEKKGKLERITLLISIPLTIILLLTILPVFTNIYNLISITLISIGMLMILLQTYKSKFSSTNKNMLNNQEYAETLISKLKERILTTSRYMWIYAFLLISGLNFGYIDILEKFNISLISRIIGHLILSSAMLLLIYYLIEKRKKENNKEILPLIEFIDNL
ncbi:hypothetical protein [Lacinutrix sp.]|uniref:hypothetical protein n=1 Tax=Lacinutrix sp. TaxID=1937692 RepID=UPI0025B94055|nr:hypothetical protein [Lacinutrix sp.]